MNIRKKIDYTELFAALDRAVATAVSQMELYCEIGRLVSARAEKGTAVAAAEHLAARYPDASGFSPRNLRRMRDFYRMYDGQSQMLERAMRLSWTQNVVILETELDMDARAWYLRAAEKNGWTKTELQAAIDSAAHLNVALDLLEPVCYTGSTDEEMENAANDEDFVCLFGEYLPQSDGRVCNERHGEKVGREDEFVIRSAATSAEELGNPVYPPARHKLQEHGINCSGKQARQLTRSDYEEYDLLIGMDQSNLRNMQRICGGDPAGKMHLLLDYTDRPGNVADPWYTGDFDAPGGMWRKAVVEFLRHWAELCRGCLHDYLDLKPKI